MISTISDTDRILLRVSHVFLILALTLSIESIQSAHGAEFEALDEPALRSLGEHLTAMEKLAPQLRNGLRSASTSMKFAVSEIHDIELSIEKAQSDIERLIVMHNTDRVKPVRAHSLVNDLRRKGAALDQGLSRVTQRLEKKYGAAKQEEAANKAYSEEESQLLSLLQDYTRHVNQSLQLLSGENR